MIAVLAGRRIDKPGSEVPRFPASVVRDVRNLIIGSFKKNRVSRLICSAACGADLLALEVAKELNIPADIFLPFERDRFRTTSVSDCNEVWAKSFDELVKRNQRTELHLLNLNGHATPYFATNDKMLNHATTRDGIKAFIVWDGVAKEGDDATSNFREHALRLQLPIEEIRIPVNYKQEYITRAQDVLNNKEKFNDPEYLQRLCANLEEWDQFAYAADVLLHKRALTAKTGKASLRDETELAKYIYKDTSLPSSFKFDKALLQLTENCSLNDSVRCETVGLAGAIYKRKWQFDRQIRNLELASFYYHRGFESWRRYRKASEDEKKDIDYCNDNGWTAINYAFISELLAVDKLESVGNVVGLSDEIVNSFNEAFKVRKEILSHFDELEKSGKLSSQSVRPWVYATIAEAYFGLREYALSEKYLRTYLEAYKINLKNSSGMLPWKIRSTAQQFESLANLQLSLVSWLTHHKQQQPKDFADLPAIDINKIQRCLFLLSHPNEVVANANFNYSNNWESRKIGKTGLALSGGGFRAALYHIGVLAALAEKDQLKNIEVISCVSGGSILGTYYYLLLKKSLEDQPDAEGSVDYIRIVITIEEKFLAGIQNNLRMRIFSNLWDNCRMIFSGFSRTNRLGHLYEKYLYKDLINLSTTDAGGNITKRDEIYMHDLFINPAPRNRPFSIEIDNWKRINKVPQLVLNATSVNTGHNWQFTASWMGEPPLNINSEVDVKPRLRRMYYKDAPGEFKNFRLGYAVGSSSCVPVMFQPMPMRDLYQDLEGNRFQVELIDGGLHDNQGVASLIEQECKNMIISDASGQMSTLINETENEFDLFYRADTILQERLRELQLNDLGERKKTALINGLSTVHLKKGLQKPPVPWLNCKEPLREIYDLPGTKESDKDRRILKEAQVLLSEIRTDLDSFHDKEAYALMYLGFVQTMKALGVPHDYSIKGKYRFMAIEPYLTDETKFNSIKKLLKASSKVPLKVFRISGLARFLVSVPLLTVGWLLLHWIRTNPVLRFPHNTWEINTWQVAFVILLTVISFYAKAFYLDPKGWVRKKLALLALGTIGFLVCRIYLHVFNPIYNLAGKIRRA
jgi:predicted acylesterase/phospholipase RssA